MPNPKRPLCCEPGCTQPKYQTENNLWNRCEKHQKEKQRRVSKEKRKKKGIMPKQEVAEQFKVGIFQSTSAHSIHARTRPPGTVQMGVVHEFPTTPADLIEKARLERIRRDGPSYCDPPELVSEAGYQGSPRWNLE
jgi:hypothetical protein